MNGRVGALQLEVQKLQAEKDKALEVAAEHDRSTAKGRPYEEAVFEAVEAIARRPGRRLRRGRRPARRRRAQGRRGRGPRRLRRPPARADRVRGQELQEVAQGGARRARRGDEPARRRLRRLGRPLRGQAARPRATALREVGGDKLFVVYDPEDGSRLALDVAYSLARARVLMAKGGAEGLDASALRAEVERAMRRDGGRAPDQEPAHRARPARSRTSARSSTGWPSASAATSRRSTRWSLPHRRRRRRARGPSPGAIRLARRASRPSRRARKRARTSASPPRRSAAWTRRAPRAPASCRRCSSSRRSRRGRR